MRAWVTIYLKGVCMGAADMIPGVSGGTIALIVGIYDRLVHAIAALDPRVLGLLPRARTQAGREAFIERLRDMDIPFLLVLGGGVGTAVLLLSRVILTIFQTFPAQINAFFFGLIAASALVIYRDVAIDTPRRIAVAIAGFLLAFIVSGMATTGGSGSLPIVFLAGVIAISAMILPGISGAAFLYILGQYEFLLGALTSFVDALLGFATGGVAGDAVGPGLVVGTFLIGAVLGLVTIARIISWALEHYRMATLGFLVSLMVGALRMPIERIYEVSGFPTAFEGLGIAAAAIMGIAAVYALDRATGSLEYA